MTICPNIEGESFDQKIDRAVSAVEKTVGIEQKNNRYEKYLIDARKYKPIQLFFHQKSKLRQAKSKKSFLLIMTKSGLRTRSKKEDRTTHTLIKENIGVNKIKKETILRKSENL